MEIDIGNLQNTNNLANNNDNIIQYTVIMKQPSSSTSTTTQVSANNVPFMFLMSNKNKE